MLNSSYHKTGLVIPPLLALGWLPCGLVYWSLPVPLRGCSVLTSSWALPLLSQMFVKKHLSSSSFQYYLLWHQWRSFVCVFYPHPHTSVNIVALLLKQWKHWGTCCSFLPTFFCSFMGEIAAMNNWAFSFFDTIQCIEKVFWFWLPQGSVLSPFLYMKLLGEVIWHFMVRYHQYADDTYILPYVPVWYHTVDMS